MDNVAECYIRTNAKPEALSEILTAWLQSQIGQGKDERVPADREIYTLVIELDLSDDSFRTTADTGNNSLTCGIIARMVLPHLDDFRVISQA